MFVYFQSNKKIRLRCSHEDNNLLTNKKMMTIVEDYQCKLTTSS
ncbi:hypothetical protein LOK49_LG01G01466 [Camellia lanceoleosa]|uniref:Uncharacterized protein n=1 Tax=Camellia lanceoleosa TaxID=1840588 RepID=A0ACC0J402_9ERIC|nr:hypothetical protein LOK49_LG01G01466 [Camellia lanceoleosa]